MINIKISGDVQGVGFRQYIRYKARKLEVEGWVKNLPDGGVEAVFVGSDKNINKMINISKYGPTLAKVENVQIEKYPDQKFEGFVIIK